MRVLCIKDGPDIMYSREGILPVPPHIKVKFGEYYNVEREVIGFKNQKLYVLLERPKNFRYKKEYFIPCSDINEDKLILEIILDKQEI